MEGERGGGRGKGKKGKSKKKAAVGAVSHKKAVNVHHGAKKVTANHSNVQVVAVSTAPQEAPAKTSALHEPPMTKSKRKRLKRAASGGAAANSLLKRHAVSEPIKVVQQHAQPATAAAASAKAKVAMLTPLPAATVKPHVVSLTGGKKKKKKRKRNASESGVETTAASPKEGQMSDGKKQAATTKKVIAVLGHQRSLLTAAVTNPTATFVMSPKRNSGQVEHVEKKDVATKAVADAAKAEVVASSRKLVKKVKTMPTAATGKPALTVVSSKDEVQTSANKKQAKTKTQQPAVVVDVSKSLVTTTSPNTMDAVTQKRSIAQVADLVNKSTAHQQPHAVSVQMKGKRDALCTTVPKSEVVTIPNKVSTMPKKKETATGPTIAPAVVFNEIPTRSRPVSNAGVVTPAASPQPPNVITTSVSGTSCTYETAAPQGSVSSAASSLSSAFPKLSPVLAKPVASPLTEETQTSMPSLVRSGGLKRRRSADQSSATDPVQPPTKRSAVASEATVAQSPIARQSGTSDHRLSGGDMRLGASDLASRSRIQHTKPITKPAPTKPPQAAGAAAKSAITPAPAKERVVVAAPSKKSLSPAFQSTIQPPTRKEGIVKPVGQLHPAIQPAGQMPVKSAPERKMPPVQIQTSVSNVTQPIVKQLKPAAKMEVNTSITTQRKETARRCATELPSGHAAKSNKVEIAMDSHAFVEKMMMRDLGTKNSGGNRGPRPSTGPTVTLPPRPQNAWGASFGMVPPANVAISASRTVSTTPLSSWFLSKGCANFVKQVHFSDDEEEDDSCSSGADDSAFTRPVSTPRGIDKASPRRRASVAKNLFLESLTAQSNWRTWYGNVDLHNPLDPPLAHVPEQLRCHEVIPLVLSELPIERETSTPGKKTNELERLETDIRREKQRGSAFSEQLLMMLQGKTVSGKLLEEEYRLLLQ